MIDPALDGTHVRTGSGECTGSTSAGHLGSPASVYGDAYPEATPSRDCLFGPSICFHPRDRGAYPSVATFVLGRAGGSQEASRILDAVSEVPDPELRETEMVGCRRCLMAPKRGQLQLFGATANVAGAPAAAAHDGGVIVSDDVPGWLPIETSACGRTGFWRERTPAVFGRRVGVGPLIVAPDTSILISLRQELDEVEGGAGLIIGPQWSPRDRPVDALRDLMQLWWWRDVRFWVCRVHLRDARRPLSQPRRAAREAAVRELERDFLERGGFDTVVPQDVLVEDRPCPIHSIPPRRPGDGNGGIRWPAGQRDRELLQAAYGAGCHAFLTTDRGILRCGQSFLAGGLAILTPGQLLDAFEHSGELDDCPTPVSAPAPDISALSRLYAGFG